MFLSLEKVQDCPSELSDCLLMAAAGSMGFLAEKVRTKSFIKPHFCSQYGKITCCWSTGEGRSF